MKMNDDTVIIAKELQKLLTKNNETHVIITRGADPVILTSSNIEDAVRIFTIKKASNIVDTIGCGDAFVGGRISRIINRRHWFPSRFSRLSIID